MAGAYPEYQHLAPKNNVPKPLSQDAIKRPQYMRPVENTQYNTLYMSDDEYYLHEEDEEQAKKATTAKPRPSNRRVAVGRKDGSWESKPSTRVRKGRRSVLKRRSEAPVADSPVGDVSDDASSDDYAVALRPGTARVRETIGLSDSESDAVSVQPTPPATARGRTRGGRSATSQGVYGDKGKHVKGKKLPASRKHANPFDKISKNDPLIVDFKYNLNRKGLIFQLLNERENEREKETLHRLLGSTTPQAARAQPAANGRTSPAHGELNDGYPRHSVARRLMHGQPSGGIDYALTDDPDWRAIVIQECQLAATSKAVRFPRHRSRRSETSSLRLIETVLAVDLHRAWPDIDGLTVSAAGEDVLQIKVPTVQLDSELGFVAFMHSFILHNENAIKFKLSKVRSAWNHKTKPFDGFLYFSVWSSAVEKVEEEQPAIRSLGDAKLAQKQLQKDAKRSLRLMQLH